MLPIDEAMKLTNLEEVEKEIEERRTLQHQMVGQLYPSILHDECMKLNPFYRKEFQEQIRKRSGV